MTRIAVFGYGSLASRASAGETLGRTVEVAHPARLDGYARAWTLGRDNLRSEKTFARADGSLPRFCLGLNLEPAPGAPAPNGVLIEVTEEEVERLDLREMRYHRIDVTTATQRSATDPFDAVFAYSARPRHHHPAPPDDAILIAQYVRAVEDAFAALGPGQLQLYRETTRPCAVEIAETTLVRERIPEGNPRNW